MPAYFFFWKDDMEYVVRKQFAEIEKFLNWV